MSKHDRTGWPERLSKAAAHTALQRTGQAADPQLHTLCICVQAHQPGAPITELPTDLLHSS
eukprot:86055-Pelagomonas_calceolata.AAC.3